MNSLDRGRGYVNCPYPHFSLHREVAITIIVNPIKIKLASKLISLQLALSDSLDTVYTPMRLDFPAKLGCKNTTDILLILVDSIYNLSNSCTMEVYRWSHWLVSDMRSV